MDTILIVGLLAACGTTVSFVPQAIQTIRTHNTSGISLSMYALFTIGTLFWLIFGVLSHSWPVILANGVTLVFACTILFYKLRFK